MAVTDNRVGSDAIGGRRSIGFQSSAWLLAAIAVVIAGIAVLDRPIATWSHDHLASERRSFDLLTHLVDIWPPLASLGLLAAAIAAWLGWRPGPLARAGLTCAVAVMIAVTLKEQAKLVFGRLWPETWVDNNPSWIGNGQYGFFPFHGGRGWSSFPSGHMTVMTAPVAVIWRMLPPVRWLLLAATLAVAVGLLGADYHFLSDIVAGTVVGWACGMGALALIDGPGRVRSDRSAVIVKP